jgi:hypothetical protein
MSECRFSVPVVVRVTTPNEQTVQEIEDPRTAITALSRGVLGGFHLDWLDYGTCFEKLGRAVIDPQPDKFEAARQAFCGLAEHSHALVAPA